jgi:hypothetical protein
MNACGCPELSKLAPVAVFNFGSTKTGQHADDLQLFDTPEVEGGAFDGLFAILQVADFTFEQTNDSSPV